MPLNKITKEDKIYYYKISFDEEMKIFERAKDIYGKLEKNNVEIMDLLFQYNEMNETNEIKILLFNKIPNKLMNEIKKISKTVIQEIYNTENLTLKLQTLSMVKFKFMSGLTVKNTSTIPLVGAPRGKYTTIKQIDYDERCETPEMEDSSKSKDFVKKATKGLTQLPTKIFYSLTLSGKEDNKKLEWFITYFDKNLTLYIKNINGVSEDEKAKELHEENTKEEPDGENNQEDIKKGKKRLLKEDDKTEKINKNKKPKK
jgi:hypothetical protein